MSNLQTNEKLRNIAIIAHVDHGKTTLVDAVINVGDDQCSVSSRWFAVLTSFKFILLITPP